MRPILLATDYGVAGPYVGQLKTAIYQSNPDATVIDLIHDLPKFNPKASAYLLASYIEQLPKKSIFIGVVDPGVGSEREPVVLEAGGFSFVGPNNGLFAVIAKKLSGSGLLEIVMDEKPKSKTFHGRDIFAPVATQLATNQEIKLKKLLPNKIVGTDWSHDLSEIIYIDHYGNAVTGISKDACNVKQTLKVKDQEIKYAATFSDVNLGESFWYCNANGLVEIATREQSAIDKLDLQIGDPITIDTNI